METTEEAVPAELLHCNGSRRGKWTPEEELLTERIIEDFSLGIFIISHLSLISPLSLSGNNIYCLNPNKLTFKHSKLSFYHFKTNS